MNSKLYQTYIYKTLQIPCVRSSFMYLTSSGSLKPRHSKDMDVWFHRNVIRHYEALTVKKCSMGFIRS